MLIPVHPINPEKRIVQQLKELLEKGKVLIVPTDTVYALVCLVNQPKAITELYKIKNLSEKQSLSLLCRDVAMASQYAKNISTAVFRFMKTVTPGPYTFIFDANRSVDRRGTGNKKNVGIRIVADPLIQALLEVLDIPLISTSITVTDEFRTDPAVLDRLYGSRVAAVIDAGIREHEFSTILDCSDGTFVLLRQGKGEIFDIEVIDRRE